ncbi:hypothetical protein CW304_02670 [Bacillus sp. UFRGS-B20]|nr:hypothetical protein CW304_02670 [Bacillus sp. UFRGS-B20]
MLDELVKFFQNSVPCLFQTSPSLISSPKVKIEAPLKGYLLNPFFNSSISFRFFFKISSSEYMYCNVLIVPPKASGEEKHFLPFSHCHNYPIYEVYKNTFLNPSIPKNQQLSSLPPPI